MENDIRKPHRAARRPRSMLLPCRRESSALICTRCTPPTVSLINYYITRRLTPLTLSYHIASTIVGTLPRKHIHLRLSHTLRSSCHTSIRLHRETDHSRISSDGAAIRASS